MHKSNFLCVATLPGYDGRDQLGKIIRLLGLENLFNKKAIQPLCSPTPYQRKDVAQPPRRCTPIWPLAQRLLKWSVGS